MENKRSLTFRVAGKKDFVILNRVLFAMVMLSAALSPQPLLLTLLTILLIGTACVLRILCFSKVNDVELTLIIFADGRVRLSSNCGNIVEGFLDGQQWCTRRMSVLRVATDCKTQNLIILSRQQAPDEYRRLNMWLRHGAALLLKSEGRV